MRSTTRAGLRSGYISNRNALLMATFGFVALWAHDRARRGGWTPGVVIGPLAFALGLLSGEGTVAALAYLFAHACFVDPGRMRARVLALVPYAVVLLAWAIVYKTLGYGTHGSEIYVDPGDRPAEFVAEAVVRIPVLLAGQWLGPWSDFWLGYPDALLPWVWGWCAAVVLGFVTLVVRRLGRDAVARMFLLGSVLACVPIAGTFPADRLLGYVGLGSMGLVAMLIAARGDARSMGRGSRAAIATLVGVHLLAAPLLLPIRARSMDTVRKSLELFDRAVPRELGIRERHVIVAAAPNDGLLSYLPVTRAADEVAGPKSVRLLGSSTGVIAFTRIDARTLVLEASDGLLTTAGERMVRSLTVPFAVGDRVALGRMDDAVAVATVEGITADGRPQRVRFVFAEVLEDPRYLWLTWQTLGFVGWVPPAVGERVELPGFDLAATLAAASGS